MSLSLEGVEDAIKRALAANLIVEITPGPNVYIRSYGARRGEVSNWDHRGKVKRDIPTSATGMRSTYRQMGASIATIIDFAIDEIGDTRETR